jgi:ubiquinone biosynthesis protein
VLPENIICLVDFGMVGSVDRRTRERFVELIDAVVRKDAYRTSLAFLEIVDREEEPDRRLLERDIADLLSRHLYRPLRDIRVGKLLQKLLETASRHRLRIPPDLFLMMKALTTVEGVACMLDPAFDIFQKAAPFIRRIMLDRFAPRRISSDFYRLAADLLQFTQQFPKDLLDVARLARQRKLHLNIENRGLEKMLATHDQISNRISFSIIIAALIIGSALIVISEIPPLFYGISLIGIIGFLAAALMGIWLLVAILRKGRL